VVDVIDPNITAGIGAQNAQINPMELFSRFAYTQNALLNAQRYRAMQSAGQLYQQSVGQDGKPDLEKFTTLLGAHPETSIVAPDLLNKMASLKMIDAETTNQQLAAAGTRAQRMGNVLLAASNDPRVSAPGDLAGEGYLSQALQEGAIKEGKLPELITFAADSKSGVGALKGSELRSALKNHALALAQGANGLAANSSNFGIIDHDANGDPIMGWTNSQRQTAVPAMGGEQPTLSAGGGAETAQMNPLTQSQGGVPQMPPPTPAHTLMGAPGPMRQQQLASVAEYRNQVGARAGQTANLVSQLNIMQRYARAVDTGKFAEIKTDLANSMRSLGFSPEIYNAVGNGDLATSQALMKQFMNGAIANIANIVHTAAAGSKLGQQETLTYMAKGAPNIEMTPEGIRKVIASAKEIAHYSRLENEYVKTKLNQPGYDPVNVMNDWPSVYSSLVEKQQ